MTTTISYYNNNAESFFTGTVNADMSLLHDRFLSLISDGGKILDAGCGSGRDSKAFIEKGFRVAAFDASAELAKFASEYVGVEIAVKEFADVNEVSCYDGIWACASLLHLPKSEVQPAIDNLWRALKPGGTFYLSFKFGDGERVQDGRHFTDADEQQMQLWFAKSPGFDKLETWITSDVRPGRSERWINALAMKQAATKNKLITGGVGPFFPHLSEAICRSSEIDLAVSFIKTTGLRLLLPDLQEALSRHDVLNSQTIRMRILTSDYLDVTDSEALRLLMLLQNQGAHVKVFETRESSFHLKTYLFSHIDQVDGYKGSAFIGSSNISRIALQNGLEWNYRVDYPGDVGFLEARSRFEELFVDPRSIDLTDTWIDAYEKRRVILPRAVAPGSLEQDPAPDPTQVQQDALLALADTRVEGFRRGLVVLATGLGKTWLAAFDVEQVDARRILFVAHRDEILNQAAETFLRIRPQAKVGLYLDREHDLNVDVLCASVQTLGRNIHLERFPPNHFDYIVIDEFHHAAAPTYRRLLNYFSPRFLLGLTATPDRTDQSDILSLCDDNLVFSCGLINGINLGLLSPFHYYGIFDDSVDYSEIPWRNGRFDPEMLSNKLATLARSRHALRAWQQRKQERTLAFCVSKMHADFMAKQFLNAGIPCCAVYSGSEANRVDALEGLRNGKLKIIFSVDLFSEGVDLPSIDTVMMLRPTESKILFLQQLGRGLRKSDGKEKLVILDFIGNHKSFLHKPQALLGIGSSYKKLAEFARDAEREQLDLPAGCFVNYDLQLIEFLKSLDGDSLQKEYEAIREVLGRRPTLTEFFRGGASLQTMRKQFGGWFEFVDAMSDLSLPENAIARELKGLLDEVETTSMTKSYKMILLEAFQELDGWREGITIQSLAIKSWEVLNRRRKFLSDLPESQRNDAPEISSSWIKFWLDNPINAWIGGNRAQDFVSFFEVQNQVFKSKFNINGEQMSLFVSMIQELIDYRLAAYEIRQSVSENNVIPFQHRDGGINSNRIELPYFPNLKIACGHFKGGTVDAEEYRTLGGKYGDLDMSRHFIANASGNSMDGGDNPIKDGDFLLMEYLYPTQTKTFSEGIYAIERNASEGIGYQYLLRQIINCSDGKYSLKASNSDYENMELIDEMKVVAVMKKVIPSLEIQIGKSFLRENIPGLFGEQFNPGNWNSGHVLLSDKKTHILLVTLNKQGKADDHKYLDRWVDERIFHWQSQNSTSPTSKRGREIIDQFKLGTNIHLFIRESKLSGGKGAPFIYYGTVQYKSHTGSSPMNVIFELEN